MIEVQDLVKRYGGRCAVDHLSFTVEDGQIFGLLGPNGAGKSTTMNMMTGYLAVTEGRVVIQGHDVLEDPEAARRCVGYLPEVPPVYPEMTAEEYLLFAAELKKIPAGEREEQVEKVLSLTGTEEARDRLVRNLSKGYRQRLGLAQAILGFPPVIILDEPTVGLDPKQVVEIRQLIRNLGRNHTVLLSSHILSEIRAVCDKVLILRKGKAVACDTPEALEGKLSAGHARALLSVPDSTSQKKLAQKVVAEGLSVRQSEALAKRLAREREELEEHGGEKPVDPMKLYRDAAAKELSTRWGRKVSITMGPKKGKLEFEFYNDEDLTELLDRLEKTLKGGTAP